MRDAAPAQDEYLADYTPLRHFNQSTMVALHFDLGPRKTPASKADCLPPRNPDTSDRSFYIYMRNLSLVPSAAN